MSSIIPSRNLGLLIKRRPYVCSDCQTWLTVSSKSSRRRWISQNHLRKIQIAENDWTERKEAIAGREYQSVLERLEERGYVNQVVGNRDELDKVLTERRVGVYCGVDPTAASLHIGHMVPFMALGWLYVHGYASTFLVSNDTSWA